MVLLPLNFRRRSKRSTPQVITILCHLRKQGSALYSAVGSREALGSSNNSIPAEDSVSVANERMNVRELFKMSPSTPERSRNARTPQAAASARR
jgi:hypothetical protein